jgi:hypothetical protein
MSRPAQLVDAGMTLNDRLERIEVMLNRMLATLDNHDRTLQEIAATLPRLGFHWPWEHA